MSSAFEEKDYNLDNPDEFIEACRLAYGESAVKDYQNVNILCIRTYGEETTLIWDLTLYNEKNKLLCAIFTQPDIEFDTCFLRIHQRVVKFNGNRFLWFRKG